MSIVFSQELYQNEALVWKWYV